MRCKKTTNMEGYIDKNNDNQIMLLLIVIVFNKSGIVFVTNNS